MDTQRHKGFLLLYIIFFFVTGKAEAFHWQHDSGTSTFGIKVSSDGKYYMVHVNNRTWLSSDYTYFNVKGQTYSLKSGDLKVANVTNESGEDLVGPWKSTSFHYLAGATRIRAAIKTYKDIPAIVFMQDFVDGTPPVIDGGGAGSGFPVFKKLRGDVDLGFLAYGGIMCGDLGKKMGKWPDDKFVTGEFGGPVTLFDQGSNVLIMSPMSEFMAASSTVTYDNNLAWGVMGSASSVSPGFLYQTILYFGDQGINQVFSDWGSMLRKYHNRTDKFREADFTNNYLGFWMDGGAFYEFTTEKYKDYDETIMDIKRYSDSWKIPYRYTEIDEWFYCDTNGDCNNWGTISWTPVPYIFPNGIKYISEKTGWPIHASNKWWSSDTIYAKQNGGNFTFLVDIPRKGALPQDQAFWDYLMKYARSQNIIVYEQDFQDYQADHLDALHTDARVGRNWLMQMGAAAEKHGLTIQYCMARSWNIMQALEIPTVTQARVSQDYKPGFDMWKIGISSMFCDAMGIAPFKDNFFTGDSPPYADYNTARNKNIKGSKKVKGAGKEPAPELMSVIATLSTGPVGPSDKIGCSNPQIIKRCCNQDGLILKPSKPAMAIDKQIQQNAFGGEIGPQGEVWTTYTDISDYRFGVILAVDLHTDYYLKPADTNFWPQLKQGHIFAYVSHGAMPQITTFSQTNTLHLKSCKRPLFCLYYVTPVLNVDGDDISILGELDKWVPVSAKRITRISASSSDIELHITGAENEVVTMWFESSGHVFTIQCVIPSSNEAVIYVKEKSCRRTFT